MKSYNNRLQPSISKKWKFFQHLSFCLLLSLVFSGVTLKAQTFNTTFKPNASGGNDAWIENVTGCVTGYPYDSYDDTNFGNESTLRTVYWTFDNYSGCGTIHDSEGSLISYIRFDELNNLPANATIFSATLRLFGVQQSDIPNEYGNTSHPGASSLYLENSIKIGSVQGAWDEQTITWNNSPTIDFSANIVHPASTAQFGENISIDITGLVQAQFNSGNNFGYGIQLQNEAKYRSWYWASSDISTDSLHPELVIVYSIPCSADFTFCYDTHNSQYTFTPNSQNGDYYNWNFGNGIGIVTNQPATIPISFQPGSYKVCLTVEDKPYGKCKKCFDLCVSKIQPDDTPQSRTKATNTSLDTNKGVAILNIYPNPVTQQFTLNIEMEKSGNGKLIIYDMTGKPISEKSVTFIKGIQTLKQQCSGLSAGIYMCTIIMDDKSDSKTFIVE